MNQQQIINVGILGAGQPNIATSMQLPACMESSKVQVTALCDRLDGVHDIAKQHGSKAYLAYQDMLNDPDIDMIQVATPDWCHYLHTQQALKHGKHVLLQKPPCLTVDELKKLQDASHKSKARLKVLLNQRQTQLTRSIKKHLDDGVIGELREIKISYRGRRFPINDPESRYLKPETGGVWIHNSLHWLDEAFYYSGILPSAIQVFANRNDNGSPEYLGHGPNYWSAFFEMGDSITFHFDYNTMLLQDNLPSGMQRILIGTEGEIRQTYGDNKITLYSTQATEPEELPVLDSHQEPLDAAIDSFRLAIDAFADEITTGQAQAPLVSDSLFLMNSLFSGIDSYSNNKRINLETSE